MNIFANQQWIFIAIVFFGIIFYISWLRWRERKWIEKRFGEERAIAMSFGVNYFGRTTEPGAPRKSSGFLLMFPDKLFYRSRLTKLELEIPGHRLTRVYHDSNHKGIDLHQSLMKVDFLNHKGQKDTAAFKVPYPPQWIQAVEATLVRRNRKDAPN
jgi:hypothetical protein